VVPWPDADYTGAAVTAVVRPSHVTISIDRPSGSARNVFEGRITSIAIEGDRARIRIASSPPFVADVTIGSVERLGLRQGTVVWASFKTVEVQIVT
jgi:molybdate transport system ATP-binding protein